MCLRAYGGEFSVDNSAPYNSITLRNEQNAEYREYSDRTCFIAITAKDKAGLIRGIMLTAVTPPDEKTYPEDAFAYKTIQAVYMTPSSSGNENSRNKTYDEEIAEYFIRYNISQYEKKVV